MYICLCVWMKFPCRDLERFFREFSTTFTVVRQAGNVGWQEKLPLWRQAHTHTRNATILASNSHHRWRHTLHTFFANLIL